MGSAAQSSLVEAARAGDREALVAQVDELWEWILTLPPAPDEDPAPEPEASKSA